MCIDSTLAPQAFPSHLNPEDSNKMNRESGPIALHSYHICEKNSVPALKSIPNISTSSFVNRLNMDQN